MQYFWKFKASILSPNNWWRNSWTHYYHFFRVCKPTMHMLVPQFSYVYNYWRLAPRHVNQDIELPFTTLYISQLPKKNLGFFKKIHLLHYLLPTKSSRDSSAGMTTRLRADNRGLDSRKRREILLFSTAYRPTLGPIRFPIQWVQGALPRG
jgi:hypothetical protein